MKAEILIARLTAIKTDVAVSPPPENEPSLAAKFRAGAERDAGEYGRRVKAVAEALGPLLEEVQALSKDAGTTAEQTIFATNEYQDGAIRVRNVTEHDSPLTTAVNSFSIAGGIMETSTVQLVGLQDVLNEAARHLGPVKEALEQQVAIFTAPETGQVDQLQSAGTHVNVGVESIDGRIAWLRAAQQPGAA